MFRHERGVKGKVDNKRRRHVNIAAWVIMSIVVAAAITVGACAMFMPDRPPALLGASGEVTQAKVSTQQYNGAQTVTLIPDIANDRTILGNSTGTVTADYSGNGLSSGHACMRVNDRAVIALNTALPLYRDLHVEDRGQDVRALNNELSRLGYQSDADSDRYSWNTQQGWKRLMADNGSDSDGTLLLSDILWIPEQSVTVSNWQGTTGASVTQGSQIGDIPGALVKLNIKNTNPSDQDRVITVFGQSTTLPAGQTAIDNVDYLKQVSATEEYKTQTKDTLAAGISGTLSLARSIEALRVPAGAVFGLNGSKGCIMTTDGTKHAVTVVGSSLGVSLVQLNDGGSTASITSVEIGSKIAGATCS